jgi:hypothetical protein
MRRFEDAEGRMVRPVNVAVPDAGTRPSRHRGLVLASVIAVGLILVVAG